MNFKFCSPVKIKFGENSLEVLDAIKGRNVMIFASNSAIKGGSIERVREHLFTNRISVYSDIEPNPTCDNIDAALISAKGNKAEIIIALGGGSVMDTAKCVSVLMTNGGMIEDYMTGKVLERQGLPMYLIPTTSGTGSEVTNVAVVTDKRRGVKRPIVSPYMLPEYALIVPSFTLSVPKVVTADTGWDAFDHAIESYWNKESNPISDAIAKNAIKLILDNIEKAYDNGADLEARTNMALGSLMAGVAFAETRTTALHGLSFHMTSNYNLSHGRACTLTLLPFLTEITKASKDKMTALAKTIGCYSIDEFIASVRAKLIHTGMPITLSAAGIPEEAIEELADEGLKNKIMFLTPLEINREKVIRILKTIK